MQKIHEIATQHRELSELVERDELTEDQVKDTFEALEGEMSAKAASLVAVIDNMSADTTVIDAEIKRLQARKKVISNKQESLRGYLKENMKASGITNIKCPLFSITLAKGRDVAVVVDPELVPDHLVTVEVVTKVDKSALLRELKEGSVPGARIDKTDSSLRIK